jgi:hypothetical protein
LISTLICRLTGGPLGVGDAVGEAVGEAEAAGEPDADGDPLRLADAEGDPDADGDADDVAGAGADDDGTAPDPASTTVPASVVTDTSFSVSWFWLTIHTCSGTVEPRGYPSGPVYTTARLRRRTLWSGESMLTPLIGGCWVSVWVT